MELIIRIDEQGKIGVSGPIDDKITCYGMLELAKECIQDYHRARAARRVEPAKPGDIALIGGGRRP